MPLYVQNKNEVQNEDDSPLPANTPSTSMFDNTQTVEPGNRVLELLDRQNKDFQSFTASTGNRFRVMLEKGGTGESNSTRRVSNADSMGTRGSTNDSPRTSRNNEPNNSRIAQLYNATVRPDKRIVNNSHLVKVSLANSSGNRESSRPNPQNVTSDEYLDVPNTALVKSSPKANNSLYDPLFHGAAAVQLNHSGSPQNQTSYNEDELIYEPDEESETEDCSKDGPHNGNNNTGAPAFVTRVQFQLPNAIPLPQGRKMNHAEPFDVEDNVPHSSNDNHDKANSQPNATTHSIQSSKESKHKAVTQKSTTRHANHHRPPPSEDPSEQDMSRNISSATVAPSAWQNFSSFWQENFWTIIIIAGILVLMFAIFVMTRNKHGDANYDDKPNINNKKYNVPVI